MFNIQISPILINDKTKSADYIRLYRILRSSTTLSPIYGIKPTLNKQRGRQTLFLGDDLNKWKFQNPEIKANAFYLYVFSCYFIIGNLVLLSQIYEMRFNNQSDSGEECVEYR